MTKGVILTPAHIHRLRRGALSDREVPGLSIIVSAPDRKRWRFRRVIAGTTTIVELILGAFPDHSIDEARAWAAPLSKAAARGEDPREIKRVEGAMAMLVADAHAIYMEALRRGDRKKLKPRTIADKDVIYTRDIAPRLEPKVLADLAEDDCWDAVYDKATASKNRASLAKTHSISGVNSNARRRMIMSLSRYCQRLSRPAPRTKHVIGSARPLSENLHPRFSAFCRRRARTVDRSGVGISPHRRLSSDAAGLAHWRLSRLLARYLLVADLGGREPISVHI